jgi:hypothetical protein
MLDSKLEWKEIWQESSKKSRTEKVRIINSKIET